MSQPSIDKPDAPIFAPDAFRLGDEEAALIDKARAFGRRVLLADEVPLDEKIAIGLGGLVQIDIQRLWRELRAENRVANAMLQRLPLMT
jgi:hypothetical protein